MKIKDLKDKSQVPLLTVEIMAFIEDVQTTKNGSRVRRAAVFDDTEQAILKLWNDDIEKFSAGDKVIIDKGYCKLFEGQKELMIGPKGIGSLTKKE